jgi:hypothetical protein
MRDTQPQLADWQIEIIERAASLEYEHGVARPQATSQAIDEYLDRQRVLDIWPGGLLNELLYAERMTRDPEVRTMLGALGVMDKRSPLWGALPIVAADESWRAALLGEQGEWAFIVPAFDRHGLADLVAEGMRSGRLFRRLGQAVLVGTEQVDVTRERDEPLRVFPSVTTWLKGHTRGCVIVDWREIGKIFDGISTILCSSSQAQQIYNATSRCWPRPVVGSPAVGAHLGG